MGTRAETLFRKNRPLAYSVAANYGRRFLPDRDERIQAALIGLWQAAIGFRPRRGVKFVTYAVRSMFNQIIREWRDEKCPRIRRATFCASDLIDEFTADVPDPEQALLAAEHDMQRKRTLDEARRVARTVSSRRGKLDGVGPGILRSTLDGRSMREIGAEYGLSHEAVRLVVARIVEQTRAAGIAA